MRRPTSAKALAGMWLEYSRNRDKAAVVTVSRGQRGRASWVSSKEDGKAWEGFEQGVLLIYLSLEVAIHEEWAGGGREWVGGASSCGGWGCDEG